MYYLLITGNKIEQELKPQHVHSVNRPAAPLEAAAQRGTRRRQWTRARGGIDGLENLDASPPKGLWRVRSEIMSSGERMTLSKNKT